MRNNQKQQKSSFSLCQNLQTYYHFQLDFQKVDQHTYNTSSPMMTSSNGNIFRVTGPLCGEITGPRWIPHTKASDAELWCFLWSARE